MQASTKKAQSIVGANNDGGRPLNDYYPTPPDGVEEPNERLPDKTSQ